MSSSTDDFVPYRYIECDVKALPLTPKNQRAIINTLIEDINSFKLGYLRVEYSAGAKVPTITFRYKDDTTERVLSEGMYLVVITVTGEKRVMTAEEFDLTYAISENNAVVGTAVVGKATL